MTPARQFPDATISARKARQLNLKNSVVYDDVALDQKFYDREFRIFHIKLVAFILLSVTGLFFLVLNAQTLLKSIYAIAI